MSCRPYRFAPASTAISLDTPIEQDNTMPSSKLPPRSRQWLAILATAVLALTATASLAPPTLVAAAPDALPLARGDIAFESMRDGDVEIYVMNAACAAGAYLTCRQCSSPDLDGFYGDADPSDRAATQYASRSSTSATSSQTPRLWSAGKRRLRHFRDARPF